MITILTAHQGEAKPFIDHYRLHAASAGGMNLFVNPPIRLLVMGQGRGNAEQSLHKLDAFMEASAQQWWINFGLCGSSEYPVGTLVTIDRVGWRKGGSLQRINGATVPGLPVSGCLSRDQPSTDYPEHGVIDMEAAAILTVLAKVSGGKNTAMFKLVSDGPGLLADTLTPAMARACVEQHAGAICRAIDDFIARYVPHEVPGLGLAT